MEKNEIREIFGRNPIFIFPANIVGGHELMAIEIIKNIQLEVNSITIYVTPLVLEKITSYFEKKITKKIEIYALPFNTIRFEFFHNVFNFSYKRRINNFISELCKNQFSRFILVQGDIETGSSYLNILNKKKISVISYIPYAHTSKTVGKRFPLFRELYARNVFSKNYHYITISNTFKKDIINRNKKSKVYVINNCVRDLFEIKEIIRHNFSKDNQKFNIYIIGRVDYKHKGHDILLGALSLLDRDILSKICLSIIGEGKDIEDLKYRVEKNLSDIDLVLHGWLEEPWQEAYKADLLVIPSRFEGVPLVMLEALELNIDVVATARDGMLDYLPKSHLFTNESELAHLIKMRVK